MGSAGGESGVGVVGVGGVVSGVGVEPSVTGGVEGVVSEGVESEGGVSVGVEGVVGGEASDAASGE